MEIKEKTTLMQNEPFQLKKKILKPKCKTMSREAVKMQANKWKAKQSYMPKEIEIKDFNL